MGKRVGRRAFVGGAVSVRCAAGLEPVRAARPAGCRRRSGDGCAPRWTPSSRPRAACPPRPRPAAWPIRGDGLPRSRLPRAAPSTAFRALDSRAAWPTHLEKTDAPAGFVAALRDAVYEAYYSNPVVWKLIGYQFRSGPRPTAAARAVRPAGGRARARHGPPLPGDRLMADRAGGRRGHRRREPPGPRSPGGWPRRARVSSASSRATGIGRSPCLRAAGLRAQLRRGPRPSCPNDRKRPEDYPITTAGDGPVVMVMYNAVGGSTVHWERPLPALSAVRLPGALARRRRRRLAARLRGPRALLRPQRPHDRRVGLAGDPAHPPRAAPDAAAAARHARARRWRAASTSSAGTGGPPTPRSSRATTTAGRAATTAAPATSAAPPGAKASTDVTYWPLALRRGAELRTRCRVREITVDARRPGATASLYYDRKGTGRSSAPRSWSSACNGVGTPRLLLNSRSRLFPDGLANRSGLVGKNLMFHPSPASTASSPSRLEGHTGPTGCSLQP